MTYIPPIASASLNSSQWINMYQILNAMPTNYVSFGQSKEQTPLEKKGISGQDLVNMMVVFRGMFANAFNKDTAFHYFNAQFEHDRPSDEEMSDGRIPSYTTKAELALSKIQNIVDSCDIGNGKVRFAMEGERVRDKIRITSSGEVIISPRSSDWDMSPDEMMETAAQAFFNDPNTKSMLVRRCLSAVKPSVNLDTSEATEKAAIEQEIANILQKAACASIPEEIMRSYEEDAVQYSDKDSKDPAKRGKADFVRKYDELFAKASVVAGAVCNISPEDPELALIYRNSALDDVQHRIDVLESISKVQKIADRFGFSSNDLLLLASGLEDTEAIELAKKTDSSGKPFSEEYSEHIGDLRHFSEVAKIKVNGVPYVERFFNDEMLTVEEINRVKAMAKNLESNKAYRHVEEEDAAKFFSVIDKMIDMEESFGGRRSDGTIIKTGIPEDRTAFSFLKRVLDDDSMGIDGANLQAGALIRMIDLSCARDPRTRREAYEYLEKNDINDKIAKINNYIRIHNGKDENIIKWKEITRDPRRGLNFGPSGTVFDIDDTYLNIRRNVVKNPPLSASYDIEKAAREAIQEGNMERLERLEKLSLALEVKMTSYAQNRSKDLVSLDERYGNWLKNIDVPYDGVNRNAWLPPDEYLLECISKVGSGEERDNPHFEEYQRLCDEIAKYVKTGGEHKQPLSSANRNDVITLINLQNCFENMEGDIKNKLIGKDFKNDNFAEEYKMELEEIINHHEKGKMYGDDGEGINHFSGIHNDKGNVLFYTPFDGAYGEKFLELQSKKGKERADYIREMLQRLQAELDENPEDFVCLNIPGNPYSGFRAAGITDICVDLDTYQVSCYIGDNKFTTDGVVSSIERHNGEPIPFSTYLTMASLAKENEVGIVTVNTSDPGELYKAALALAMNGIDFECENASLSAEEILEVDKIRNRARRNSYTDKGRKATISKVRSYVDNKEQSVCKGAEVLSSVHSEAGKKMKDLRTGFDNKNSAVSDLFLTDIDSMLPLLTEFYRQDKDKFSYLREDEEWQNKIAENSVRDRANMFADRFTTGTATAKDKEAVLSYVTEHYKDALCFIAAQAFDKLDTSYLNDDDDWIASKGSDSTLDDSVRFAQRIADGKATDKDLEALSDYLFGSSSIDEVAFLRKVVSSEMSAKEVGVLKDALKEVQSSKLSSLAKECYRVDRNIFTDEQGLSWSHRSVASEPENADAEKVAKQMVSRLKSVREADGELGRIFNAMLNYEAAKIAGKDTLTYQKVMDEIAMDDIMQRYPHDKDTQLEILDAYESEIGKEGIEVFKEYLEQQEGAGELDASTKKALVAALQDIKSKKIQFNILSDENREDLTSEEIKSCFKSEFDEKVVEQFLSAEKAKYALLADINNTSRKYIDKIDKLSPELQDKYNKQVFANAMMAFKVAYIDNPDAVIEKLGENGYNKEAKKLAKMASNIDKIARGKMKEEDALPALNFYEVCNVAACFSNGKVSPIAQIVRDEQKYLKEELSSVYEELQKRYDIDSDIRPYILVVYAAAADEVIKDNRTMKDDFPDSSLIQQIDKKAVEDLKNLGILKDGEDMSNLASAAPDKDEVYERFVSTPKFESYIGRGSTEGETLEVIKSRMQRKSDKVFETAVSQLVKNSR